MADLTEMIGLMYGKGTGCVELNNHGYTVVDGLRKKNYPMYNYKPGDPGWSTNKKTKPLMVDGLYEAAKDRAIEIMCAETVTEMRTFVEDNGTYGAEAGCKDDRVVSAQMASMMMEKLPLHGYRPHDDDDPEDHQYESENQWMVA